MKKWLGLALAVLLFSVPARAEDIWAEKTEKTITEGVRLVRDVRFSSAGWHRANILEVDLKNENLELTALFDSRGISKNKTVLSMAEEKGVVAAVNGDFFNWEGTPLGFTVEDGRVISSPAHDPGLAALIEDADGNVFTDYLDMKLMVTCPAGYEAEVLHINKYHSMQSMVLYTSDWGEKTPGSHDGISELVAVDGIVQEVRRDMDGVQVPENGFVLAISTHTSTYLVDNFQPGDAIELSYSLTPDIGKIETAIGGGSVLVEKGKRAAFTNEITGTHPRTAAGITEDGEKLLLVTVDGRQTALAGMSQAALADYMISLGAYSAINLDGGGSTTMVAREGETGQLQVVNLPSDGNARAVSTGLGVRFTGKNGEFSSLEVNMAGGPVTVDGMAHLYLGAYDEYHNPVFIADKTITYSSEDGTFSGNIFYPAHSGTCVVTAECEGITGSLAIEVLPAATDFAEEKPEKGVSVLLLPGKAAEQNCMDILAAVRLEKLAEEAEMVYTFGDYDAKAAQPVSRFSATEIENSLFVTVNAKGGIRKADADQWQNIMEICKETEAKNVFFLLSSPLSAFSDSAEAELLETVLSETLHARGTDVFLVSTGEKTEMTEKNGIRYVTVAKEAEISAKSLFADSAAMCGARFTVKGDAVHFEGVPLWARETA